MQPPGGGVLVVMLACLCLLPVLSRAQQCLALLKHCLALLS
jgi:hypothetical protein